MERVSVSAISLRHIIWLPHESHASMSLPTADLRVQPAGIWLRQESKAHFGIPWVRPWDYRGKCYMNGKRIKCLSNTSHDYPLIKPASTDVRHFSTFWPVLGTIAWCMAGHTRENRGKCYIDGKKIQCLSNASHNYPLIKPVSSDVRHFSTFWPVLGTPLGKSR